MRKRSWKTTLGGAVASAGAVLFGAPLALGVAGVDIPKTVLVRCVVVGFILQAVGAFVTGLFSRDNNRTSEEVGVDAAAKASRGEQLIQNSKD